MGPERGGRASVSGAGGSESAAERRARAHVNTALVVAMLVVAVVAAVVGWSLRPEASGFPPVPAGLAIGVNSASLVGTVPEASTESALPGGIHVYERLTRTADNEAMLDLTLYHPTPSTDTDWELFVYNLGSGRLCTPARFTQSTSEGGRAASRLPAGIERAEPRPTATTRTVTSDRRALRAGRQGVDTPISTPPTKADLLETRVTVVSGHGFVEALGHPWFSYAEPGQYAYVRLCWKSAGPVSLKGGDLSARFPPVAQVHSVDQAVPPTSDGYGIVDHSLAPGTGQTADFTLQSRPDPDATYDPVAWHWTKTALTDPSVSAVTAVDTDAAQQDANQAVYCGIFLGIAGAALIAALAELLGVFKRSGGADA